MTESIQYDSQQKQLIHQLIDTAFSDEDLITFCATYFRDVFNGFTAETSKAAKIKLLIESSAQQGQLPKLIGAIKQVKPDDYETFAQQIRSAKPTRKTQLPQTRPVSPTPRPAPLAQGGPDRSRLIHNPERFIDRSLEGRYRINEILDRSGLGAVFKAYDTKLRLDVAVKIIDLAQVKQPTLIERVRREVQTAQKLDHPGVVRVYDFGQTDSLLYIIMEYIPGFNLNEARQQFKALNPNNRITQILQIMQQVCLTVDYMHQQGVLHPGTKPENIMLKPGQGDETAWRPVLINLGLLRPNREAIMSGVTISPHRLTYTVSPELLVGHNTDTRSDVYTLGIILYDLVVGRPPFTPQNLEEATRMHVETLPPEPHTINPNVPEKVQRVILKALAKERAERYLSAKEMAQAIGNCLDRPALPPAPDNITISMQDSQLVVAPGETSTTTVRLYNEGKQNAKCQIKVQGIPAEWVSISPSVTTLAPDEEQEVDLSIEPPQASASRAKHYSLSIQVVGQRDRQQLDEVKAVLKVARYIAFESSLWPVEISPEQITQVTIENQGNATETFTIRPKPERGLFFEPDQAQLKLGPGDSGKADFRVTPRLRVVGEKIMQTFSFAVSLPDGETVTHSGEITSEGLMPVRALLAALLTLGLLTCVVLSFYTLVTESLPQGATAQAQNFQVVSAAARGTAILRQRGTATSQAIQTATWIAGDSDRDGLSSQQEILFNTDPTKFDTDGDGLSDGIEIQLRTNPLNTDSDADGLTDFEERELGLDPINPDTDGDGLFDKVDPDPRNIATPVPTSTPIPTLRATAPGPLTAGFSTQQYDFTQANPPRYQVREDAGRLDIQVQLSRSPNQRVLINYNIFSGRGATFGQDYTGQTSGTLVFEPEERVKSIALDIIDDNIPSEQLESVLIRLTDQSSPPVLISFRDVEVIIIDN